ncbi:hypothetical protein ACQKN7_27415 [Bacillus cereus]|uniref:hypothetical protein n=1 Tax=Bacillus cereus TaxID=1396 RepID=UPI003D0667BD
MKKINELKDEEKEHQFNWKIALVIVGIFLFGVWRVYENLEKKSERELQAKMEQIEKREAEKKIKKEERRKAREEAERKALEEESRERIEQNEVKPDHFVLGDAQGKRANRGLLHIGSVKAIQVGMKTEEVAKKLNKNAAYGFKTTMNEVEGVEYTYNAPMTILKVFYVDNGEGLRVYSLDHAETDRNNKMKLNTLDNNGTFTEGSFDK